MADKVVKGQNPDAELFGTIPPDAPTEADHGVFGVFAALHQAAADFEAAEDCHKHYRVYVLVDCQSEHAEPYLYDSYDTLNEAIRDAKCGRAAYPYGNVWVEDKDGVVFDLETGRPKTSPVGADRPTYDTEWDKFVASVPDLKH